MARPKTIEGPEASNQTAETVTLAYTRHPPLHAAPAPEDALLPNAMRIRFSAACLIALATLASCLIGCQKDEESVVAAPVVETEVEPEVPKSTPTFEIHMKAMASKIPVIMYHDIVKARGRRSVWFDCSRDEFKAQLDLIQERGYTPISVEQLHKHLTGETPAPPKAIVLTFDDNYQGFYDNAYPLLKERQIPAVMFVHTKFVGDKEGAHPKMTWETLRELAKDPLITIASHTVTHRRLPELTPEEQTQELTDSKIELEKELGKPMDYFAYPEGANDRAGWPLVQAAGYKMAFSIDNGQAEESPSILCVNRYIHTRLEKALEESEEALAGSASRIAEIPWKESPVNYREETIDGKTIALVTGGKIETLTSATRESVSEFIARTPGAVAGINGTFFSMAAIAATDNKLVGPSKTAKDPIVLPDPETTRFAKLKNRPMVVFGPRAISFVPFNPERMNEDSVFRAFMPDFTDCFLTGAWLVHQGVARERSDILRFGSKDAQDARRRAAFGVMADGTPVAACAKNSVSSSAFAEMLASLGVQEAVLLDSGFSTSLVYNNKILASGHSTAEKPSRPVPHAILFFGTLDPAGVLVAEKAEPATKPEASPRRKRRRKKAASPDAGAPAPDAPAASGPVDNQAAGPDAVIR